MEKLSHTNFDTQWLALYITTCTSFGRERESVGRNFEFSWKAQTGESFCFEGNIQLVFNFYEADFKTSQDESLTGRKNLSAEWIVGYILVEENGTFCWKHLVQS